MIRRNKDGRPIYSDKIWNQMREKGEILEKLGYKASNKKPNLFYKKIGDGFVFADLRGTSIVPIWDDARPLIYKQNLSYKTFLIEFITLVRAGCDPRVSFYEECEPDGWMFSLSQIPTGYCKRCGEDILYRVKWDLLKEDFFKLYEEGIELSLELEYCETCRKIEYSKKKYRLKHNNEFKLCELCVKNKAEVRHHITYSPEIIIKLCRSCHGKVHSKGYPNHLWKQRKNQIKQVR